MTLSDANNQNELYFKISVFQFMFVTAEARILKYISSQYIGGAYQ